MTYAEAPACKANISPAGRRMRLRFGRIWVVASAGLLVVLAVMRVPWYGGLLLFIPAWLAALGLLQARRNTCVKRAKEGTFENDDLSAVKAPDDEVAASRAVAAGIHRDALLAGLAGAAVAVALAIAVRLL